MAIYTNSNPKSAIATVEFSPVSEGNVTFFHLKAGTDPQEIKQWLTADMSQEIEAETKLGNETVLVTRGDKTQADIINGLVARGEQLREPETKRKVSMWALRGWGSIIGQPMQLASGLFQKGLIDSATIGFSVMNMAANFTNIIFGAEKRTAPNHLRFIKEKVNSLLTSYVPEGTQLPDPADTRAPLRKDPAEPKKIGLRFHDYMKAHSVVVGDILLRYLGSISLAFALKKPDKITDKLSKGHWKTGMGQLFKGEFKTAYDTLKTTDRATHYAGLMYLGGKMISLTSKVHDPYDKDAKSDVIRERIVFPLSSVIEAAAAGLLTVDRLNILNFKNEQGVLQKRTISVDGYIKSLEKKGKTPWKWLKSLEGKSAKRDWIGGIGGIFLTAGLVMRIFAPFAVREVNMEEVDAHVADALAKVPPNKLPQATAEAAAFLTDHFKDKKLEFSKVYTQLTNDLYRYHNIALPTAEGGEGCSPQMDAAASAPESEKSTTFAKDGLKKPDPASLPRSGSYQDLAAATKGTAALGVGA